MDSLTVERTAPCCADGCGDFCIDCDVCGDEINLAVTYVCPDCGDVAVYCLTCFVMAMDAEG